MHLLIYISVIELFGVKFLNLLQLMYSCVTSWCTCMHLQFYSKCNLDLRIIFFGVATLKVIKETFVSFLILHPHPQSSTWQIYQILYLISTTLWFTMKWYSHFIHLQKIRRSCRLRHFENEEAVAWKSSSYFFTILS